MAHMLEPAPDEASADPLWPQLVRVRRRHRDAPDVWTLELDTDGPSPFAAGQFNMLTAFGTGEVPISFSGDPAQPERITHTIRAVGPVSTALTRLRAGASLGLRGPFGNGWPISEVPGRDVLIVAGGLGLAPLRPVIYQLLAARTHEGRISVLYGTRSPTDILFHRQLEAWRRRGDIGVEVTVDHAIGPWHGHVGVVTTLIDRARFDPQRTLALVCGPEIMMRFTAEALIHAGVDPESIHLSMERTMKCAIGTCGHCQFGTLLICRDGPVVRYDRLREALRIREW